MKIINITEKSTKRKFNQDAFYGIKIGNYYYSLVADGFGTSQYSHIAAKYITSEFDEFFNIMLLNSTDNVPKEDIIEQLRLIRKHLLSVKPHYDIQFGACLSILKYSELSNKYELFHIGDTEIFAITKDRKLKKLTHDHNLSNYIKDNDKYNPNVM